PEATLLALEACEPTERIHLIAGGYDKGADLAPIRDRTSRLAGLYAIGRTASKLLGRGAQDWIDLESATRAAALAARDGDTILLSPGCASWDQFRNFEARGQAFRDLARRLFEEPDLADGDGP
ncbi:MAG: UDP-N-acetylmuramoyl-L-alanine--D-glutamate ligase, partial [Phycisphaera sp.]|nr:UDP-N-acetylmuramoyl-L-alanine--D-glutamate ligase [Phycisphaera sp.]